jgi:hypothetical protein
MRGTEYSRKPLKRWRFILVIMEVMPFFAPNFVQQVGAASAL